MVENVFIIIYPQHVELTFDDYFNIEHSDSCLYDYLNITINDVTSSYCGRHAPVRGIYDGPIHLHFHSDGAYTGEGFSVHFREITTGKP